MIEIGKGNEDIWMGDGLRVNICDTTWTRTSKIIGETNTTQEVMEEVVIEVFPLEENEWMNLMDNTSDHGTGNGREKNQIQEQKTSEHANIWVTWNNQEETKE